MYRNKDGGASWRRAGAAYVLAAGAAGSAAGASLGSLGSAIGVGVVDRITLVLAAFGIAAGMTGVRPVRPPPQLDRETPARWLAYGPTAWGMLNGASLGLGAFSRIGWWLWYAVPTGAFISRDAVVGAVVFGAYALTRASCAALFLLTSKATGRSVDSLGRIVLRQRDRAAIATSVVLVVLSTLVAYDAGERLDLL